VPALTEARRGRCGHVPRLCFLCPLGLENEAAPDDRDGAHRLLCREMPRESPGGFERLEFPERGERERLPVAALKQFCGRGVARALILMDA